MSRPLTDAEAGRALTIEDTRGHRSLRHDVERVENEEYHDTERCTECGATAPALGPERCPAKAVPEYREAWIEARTIRADGRDRELAAYREIETVGARVDSMHGVPARGDD
jgi:hypothetical protein